MAQKTSAADVARVEALYEQGELNKVIAEQVGITRNTVAKIIKEGVAAGRLTAREQFSVSDEDIRVLRVQCMSSREIGEKLGCSFAYVHKRIQYMESAGLLDRVDARTERHARQKLGDPNTPEIVRVLLRNKRQGESLKDLTVLSEGNDPYRVDAPDKMAAGRWLAGVIADVDAELGYERVWWNRGLHYIALGRRKFDGEYGSNDWEWLDSTASKAARWSGLVPFERLEDRKNNPPIIRLRDDIDPVATFGHDLDSIDLRPTVWLADFNAAQPYRIAQVAEKSSARDVLGPLSDRYKTDLFLPDGEMTDSQIYLLAKAADADGRPLVVLYYSDCDPSGYQMPISVSRKLQALRDIHFPDLEFVVVQALLTPEQVAEFRDRDDELPATPLKDPEDEKRGPAWLKAWKDKGYGRIEQTELDALTSLRPDVFEELAVDMIERFFDAELDEEVERLREEWEERAQKAVDALADSGEQDRLRREAEDAIEALRAQIEADFDRVELPDIPELPDSDLDPGEVPNTVLDSADDWRTQTFKLKARKRYESP